MAEQLDALGVAWTRISAVDSEQVEDEVLDAEIDREKIIFRMSRGSQACAISNFNIWRQLADSSHKAALILQDDIVISADIAEVVKNADWLPEDHHLIQLERYGRQNSKKLLGPIISSLDTINRHFHPLHSRTAGAGAYIITRAGAERALAVKRKARVPIDQILFNMNVSEVARALRVAIVQPYLAEQKKRDFRSDIQTGGDTKTRRKHLWRAWFEINLIPKQLFLVVLKKAAFLQTTMRL